MICKTNIGYGKFGENMSSKYYVLLLTITLSLMTGCASGASINTPGDVQKNTQLAISPNGSRLLVSWRDSKDKLHAKLLEIRDGAIALTRVISLPEDVLFTAFAKTDEQILLTTWDTKYSKLLKKSLVDENIKLIYQSQFALRFPIEISNESYAFLEGVSTESRSSQWQRYQENKKTLLNEKHYRLATNLNVVGDSLFLLEPWKPPAFRILAGASPVGLNSLIDKDTWSIDCADRTTLVCVKNSLLNTPHSGYRSILELINGRDHCKIEGQWNDLSDLAISRDGSTVVFHAAIADWGGARSIYLIKNIDNMCKVNTISIRGDKL